MVNYTYKIAATNLKYRSEPSLQANILGVMVNGSTITVTDIKKADGYTWGKHSKGWTAIVAPNGHVYMTKITSASDPTTKVTPTKNIATKAKKTTPVVVAKKSVAYTVNASNKFRLKSARSILGLPAQFTAFTDPKITGSAFGRSYTENILMDMPICMITPGRPKFLAGAANSKAAKQNWLNTLLVGSVESAGSSVGDILDKLLDGTVARYYSFEAAYAEYMPYVNSLNNVLAFYLGIADKKGALASTSYGKLNWQNINKMENSEGLLDFFGNVGSIPFYYDRGGTSMSESASNSTDKSQLDGVLSTASSAAKEASFVTNSFAGKDFDPFGAKAGGTEKINQISMDLANSSSMIDQIMTNLKSGFTTVASGSNILLPEIWKDSSFSRSYTLDIHLASPYGTAESYYLNIGVPLNYLLALVLPTQFGANGYSSPFLIQAFAQGIFNCSLGMVDSITISKFGSGDSISRKNFPLEVKVSISFKDLYNSLAITDFKNTAMFANNLELVDYVATMSACNLNKPDLFRKLDLFLTSKLKTITDIPGNIKLKIQDSIRNELLRLTKY